MIICPNCQHKELPGALFCSECGAQLVTIDVLNTRSIKKTTSGLLESPTVVPQVNPAPSAGKSSEPSISLHIVDSGQVIHLKERKEFTLGRTVEGQPILPDVDLTPFDAFSLGVSRLHAALRIVNHDVVVTDLGSSNGTRVNGQKIVPHVDYPINHGDIVALGKLKIQIIIAQ
ncbi:MAG: FHA domain-containing protein [Anaerolineaceae bacterium]|jgi:pSer/pThr/pTyr-binding forkhead associated (FHA) protein|nr:FHA domain-containing protein [Anaerolineaceae bacterium]